MSDETTSFTDYLNRVAGLAISTAAAALSATILKADLIPEQLYWLGAAGTMTAAVTLALQYAVGPNRNNKRPKPILGICIVTTLIFVIVLRAGYVIPVHVSNQEQEYLVGLKLSEFGKEAQKTCSNSHAGTLSVENLITCAGSDSIPQLYGWTYTASSCIYILSYLGLLASFVWLVAGIDLRTPRPPTTN